MQQHQRIQSSIISVITGQRYLSQSMSENTYISSQQYYIMQHATEFGTLRHLRVKVVALNASNYNSIVSNYCRTKFK